MDMIPEEFVEVKFSDQLNGSTLTLWCCENIEGAPGEFWQVSFSSGSKAIFEFARKGDATLFALRWSEVVI